MLRALSLTVGLTVSGWALAQSTPAPAADPAAAAPATPAATDPAAVAAAPVLPRVALHTNQGSMVAELYPDKAPKSVENFLQYVKDGHYNGTIFHRVIDGFMIQGGGYTVDLQLKPTRPAIENEARNGLSNSRGTLAMARTNEPHSAQAQFFINVVDNPRLDFVSEQSPFTWGYAVFGKVVEGLETIDKIRALETGAQGPLARDVPLQPVIIERVELLTAPAAEPAAAPAAAVADPAAAPAPSTPATGG